MSNHYPTDGKCTIVKAGAQCAFARRKLERSYGLSYHHAQLITDLLGYGGRSND